MSNSTQFDLEQQIMDCWHVTADLDVLFEAVMEHPDFDRDKISNVVLGLKELYELKFDKMFRTFEQHLAEFYGSTSGVSNLKFDATYSDDANKDLRESLETALDFLATVRINQLMGRLQPKELGEDIDAFLKEHNDA